MRLGVRSALAALLAGFSAFGLYQSIVLEQKNTQLSDHAGRLQQELSAAQIRLNESRVLLDESYQKSARLENDGVFLRTRMGKLQEQLGRENAKIAALSAYLHKAKEFNAALEGQNRDLADQVVRTSFENQELKRTLSSVDELKKAIRELRKKPARRIAKKQSRPGVKKHKPPVNVSPVRVTKPRLVVQEAAPDVSVDGNEGYLIKDGRSTLADMVDIRVSPAQATP